MRARGFVTNVAGQTITNKPNFIATHVEVMPFGMLMRLEAAVDVCSRLKRPSVIVLPLY